MDDITTKEVKFVNDPKNLSALAKIHEISNKAKEKRERRARQSPNHINHIRVNENLRMDKNQEENFSRRKSHFPTMVYPGLNSLLKPKDLIQKGEGMRRSYINNKEKEQKGYKSEFVWDKKLNKLVEKKVPLATLDQIEEKDEKVEPEKKEIIQKLKDYKKNKDSNLGKNTEITIEKKVVKEGEIDDNDDKNVVGSKNTKIYKKVVKDENGSKIIIKKVVEEVTEGHKDDKLVFEDSDDEDMENEIKDIEKVPAVDKNLKYQVIKEKFDPQGNKIYTKEILTNKLPKEYK
jgi:hypothetical protein